MLRWLNQPAPWTVLLATLMMPTAWAQSGVEPNRLTIPARTVSMSQVTAAPQPILPQQSGAVAPQQQMGYVQLGAPLYPSPRTNIPYWTGGTVIPNQALAPHEMLYPHTYRAVYPPYYHRVKGHFLWTPFGMRTHEKWELQGTEVEVKYRSNYPLLKPFHPPR